MDEHSDENVVEQTSSSSKRGRRSTSAVWEDFTKLPLAVNGKLRAKCKWCGKDYAADVASGTSNMIRHAIICPNRNKTESRPISKFDQNIYREKMSFAIIKHNLPFKFVEHEGIRDLHSYLNPEVIPISRNTAKSDILKLHRREKEKLKLELELIPGRICLTSDMWSSLATDGYLTITAHYVDQNWVLRKRILNFHHVPPPHHGPNLAEKILYFLKEWGVEKKVISITLDNASYNDGLVNFLKKQFSVSNSLLCKGEFFHVRCGAHILNLIVQAGLKVIDESVFKIRESVKYVRGSEGRKIKFAECIIQLKLKCSKKVCQDVATRWNYTYLMLESALMFRQAFHLLQMIDTSFKTCPSDEEWHRVERIARFLKPFYDITTLFSGNQYPTANLYFHGVWKIEKLIREEMNNRDSAISSMARQMKEKFDKYWECYSMVLSFAIILDPRYKLEFVEFSFSKLDRATYQERVRIIREKLYMLFDEYVSISSFATPSSLEADITGGNNVDDVDEMDEFDTFASQRNSLNRDKSQLDVYLEEQMVDRKQNANLDVLGYWKGNQTRYPELSLMARDILSIPITTVASESAFSIGGQIISKYRSSIIPNNVEALLCTQDWINDAEEESEEEELVEDFEPIIAQLESDSNAFY